MSGPYRPPGDPSDLRKWLENLAKVAIKDGRPDQAMTIAAIEEWMLWAEQKWEEELER